MTKASYNRLIYEKSPYLLEHAHNPVDWFPWSEEPFLLAEKLNKPVFLSIGYASCHWCHVMERESFSDPGVAQMLNQTFVCIKVDREELPQVDALYMEFAQMIMASSGGWPLNVILTPDKKPFYAMTYLPPRNSKGMMGLFEMGRHIYELWSGPQKSRVLAQSEQIFEICQDMSKEFGAPVKNNQSELIASAVEECIDMLDPVYGGKKGSPKFPMSYQCEFLFEYGQRHHHQYCDQLAETTLTMMQRGGIYDVLGGGFCRYSVDDKWMIPHFEKILIDNALLAKTYLEAYKISGSKDRLFIAAEILNYLNTEMKGPYGLFFSSQDADSEHQEGAFYTWDPSEIYAKLEGEDAELFCEFYNLSKEGNFEGKNVLFQHLSLREFAKQKNLAVEDLFQRFKAIKAFLYLERKYRPEPSKDEKLLLGWNAATLEAFLRAGYLCQDQEYITIAQSGIERLRSLFFKDHVGYRRFLDNDLKSFACLEDYVACIKLSLCFYHFGHGDEYLKWARDLTHSVIQDFKAPEGCFYESSKQDTLLPIRRREFIDGTLPSSLALLGEVFYLFSEIDNNLLAQSFLQEILNEGASFISQFPTASFSMLALIDQVEQQALVLIVIVLDEQKTLKDPFLEWIALQRKERFFCVWKSFETSDEPYCAKDKKLIDGQTAFYVCHRKTCYPPLICLDELKKLISRL